MSERPERATAEALGDCPFCGGALGYATTTRGPAVLHNLPTCAKYDALEPTAFLRACNAELERLRLS